MSDLIYIQGKTRLNLKVAGALLIFSFFYGIRPKSLYRSCAGRHFYGTEYVIWAGFRPVINTKKIGADYE